MVNEWFPPVMTLDAVFAEFFYQVAGKAPAARGVFAIGDAQIDRLRLDNWCEFLGKDPPADVAENIAYKKYLHLGPLFRVFRIAAFADNGHFDLAGIFHLVLYFLRHLPGKLFRLSIFQLLRLYHDPDFAAGLDDIGL